MSTLGTSRVFDAARKMKERLDAQPWPAHPVTARVPHVAFTDTQIDQHSELVWVWPSLGDDSSIAWRSSPNGRDETFGIVVQIRVLDINDETQMLDRLEELADVVQRAVYDDTEFAASETSRINPLGVSGVVKAGGVSRVEFDIVPSPKTGLIGIVMVTYSHLGRI